ncbi:Zn(2)-C6 fungal-specific transcription factor, partial [Phycomyces blakesleeanus NRRL 1555(-)]
MDFRTYALPSPTSPSFSAQILPSSPIKKPSRMTTHRKRPSKSHVPTACVNCKKAHLACDLSRPCNRCIAVGKTDTCYDIQHKKRGRPKLRDKQSSPTKPGPSKAALSSTAGARSTYMLTPGLANSSFSMTTFPDYIPEPRHTSSDKNMMTIFLTMDISCARVSDESVDFLGVYPQELAHRSLYDLVSPEYSSQLARLHRCLLDNANISPHTTDAADALRSDSDVFNCSPSLL